MARLPAKRFTTLEEQIQLLKNRGMTISDDEEASQWLQHIGYYRLSGYWYVRRIPQEVAGRGRRLDTFQPNTNFSDIIRLYEFDRQLRTLIHDGIERIEVALRSAVSLALGEVDSLAFYQSEYFVSPEKHFQLLSTATQRINRALPSNEPIRHNIEKYGSQLAIWVLADVLDFSDLSKIFAALRPQYQRRISKLLGVDYSQVSISESQRRQLRRSHPLQSGLHQLTLLRNKSAHHARVWNTDLVPMGTPILRQVTGLELLPPEKSKSLFGALLLMAKILETVSPESSWHKRAEQVIRDAESQIAFFNSGMVGAPIGWSLQMV